MKMMILKAGIAEILTLNLKCVGIVYNIYLNKNLYFVRKTNNI